MSRFTKISATGEELPREAIEWVAVKDSGPAECPFLEARYWPREASANRMTFAEANEWVKSLDIAGRKDWRLPTVLELSLFPDRTRIDRTINTTFFPECKPHFHWTSAALASSPVDFAPDVSFYSGYVSWYYNYKGAFVRAVR